MFYVVELLLLDELDELELELLLLELLLLDSELLEDELLELLDEELELELEELELLLLDSELLEDELLELEILDEDEKSTLEPKSSQSSRNTLKRAPSAASSSAMPTIVPTFVLAVFRSPELLAISNGSPRVIAPLAIAQEIPSFLTLAAYCSLAFGLFCNIPQTLPAPSPAGNLQ